MRLLHTQLQAVFHVSQESLFFLSFTVTMSTTPISKPKGIMMRNGGMLYRISMAYGIIKTFKVRGAVGDLKLVLQNTI